MRLTIVCLFAFYAFGAQAQVEVFARVGNIKTEKATKTEILVQPFLTVHYVNAPANLRMSIYHFTFHAETGAVKTIEINCTGPSFNADVLSCIHNLKTGSVLCFDNIKVKGPDGTGRTLQPIKLTIR